MAADCLEELRRAMRSEIEEMIASWPAPARHQFVNAWHALRGEPPEAPPPEPAPMETEPTSPKRVATSEAPTPIRRNPRPVLAMLRGKGRPTPTVLRGAADGWGPSERWDAAHLASAAGHEELEVTLVELPTSHMLSEAE